MQAKLGVGAQTADAAEFLAFETRNGKHGIELGKIDQSNAPSQGEEMLAAVNTDVRPEPRALLLKG